MQLAPGEYLLTQLPGRAVFAAGAAFTGMILKDVDRDLTLFNQFRRCLADPSRSVGTAFRDLERQWTSDKVNLNVPPDVVSSLCRAIRLLSDAHSVCSNTKAADSETLRSIMRYVLKSSYHATDASESVNARGFGQLRVFFVKLWAKIVEEVRKIFAARDRDTEFPQTAYEWWCKLDSALEQDGNCSGIPNYRLDRRSRDLQLFFSSLGVNRDESEVAFFSDSVSRLFARDLVLFGSFAERFATAIRGVESQFLLTIAILSGFSISVASAIAGRDFTLLVPLLTLSAWGFVKWMDPQRS